jgi:hypothetical protein
VSLYRRHWPPPALPLARTALGQASGQRLAELITTAAGIAMQPRIERVITKYLLIGFFCCLI